MNQKQSERKIPQTRSLARRPTVAGRTASPPLQPSLAQALQHLDSKVPLNTPRRSLGSLLRFRVLNCFSVDCIDLYESGQGPPVPPMPKSNQGNHPVHWAGWRLPEAIERLLREVETGARTATIELAEGLAQTLQVSPAHLAFDGDEYGWKPTRRVRSAGMPARLQRARRRCGLSLQQLGAVAGLPAAHIRQAEAGQIAAGLDLIEALASALDVPPGWLAYGEGPEPGRE